MNHRDFVLHRDFRGEPYQMLHIHLSTKASYVQATLYPFFSR
jgi:hypothetical protein